MEIDWNGLFESIGKTYFASSLIPLVLGVLISTVKWGILSDEDFRRRATLLREKIVESQANSLAVVLERTQSLDSIATIRASTPGGDPLILYISRSIATVASYRSVDSIVRRTRVSYSVVWWTILVALIALVVAYPFMGFRPAIAIFCYALIVLQLICVVVLRQQKIKLEKIEDAY